MVSARLGVVVALLNVSSMARQGSAQTAAVIQVARRVVAAYDVLLLGTRER
jgi:hypothetical protein